MIPDIIRVLVPAAATFAVGIAITPIVSHYLYTFKAWKKRPGKVALDGSQAQEFNRLHVENEVRAPRMGGIVIWGSVLLTTVGILVASTVFPEYNLQRFNFLSRNQTWLPLATLFFGSIVGLIDDLMVIRPSGEGLRLRFRLIIVVILSFFIGWWFWDKLGVTVVDVPFHAPLQIGWLIVPLFILVSLALYASGVIDGIDGLSGGVFASIFASYAIISYFQQQIGIAAFCSSVVGGLLAFLWFNVPPARYYMTDTGTMGLTLALAVIAFLTDSPGQGIGIVALPIIGGLLVVTVASNLLQLFWKRFIGRKLLLVAPLHHHFEALGWPGYKVTMRYWILSVVFGFAGVILALSSLS